MKKYIKFIIPFILCLVFAVPSFAASSSIDINSLNLNSISESKLEEVQEIIENMDANEYSSTSALTNADINEVTSGNLNSIDTSSINTSEIASVYAELSEVLSNDEIADLLEDNSDLLEDAGISNTTVSAGTTILRSLSTDDVVNLLDNDLDINELLDLYNNGASIQELLSYVASNTSTQSKLNILVKLLFSNTYTRIVLFVLILVFIYSLFVTSKIFKKAGKKRFCNYYSNI